MKYHINTYSCLLLAFLCVRLAGCVHPPPRKITRPDREVVKIHYIGHMEEILVEGASLKRKLIPKEPNNLKIVVQLDPRDIPKFVGVRERSEFKISSLKRYPALDVNLSKADKKGRLELLWSISGNEGATRDAKIALVRRCLHMWSEGETCLLEFYEPVGQGHGFSPQMSGN